MAVDDQTEEALGWAAEGAKYAQEYTPKDITLKDAATFVAEATPIIGDAMAAKQVYDELQKDEPNYLLAGALGGAAIIGLVPGLGDAAAAAIRKGAKTALDTAKRVEIDPDALGMMGGNIRLAPKKTLDDFGYMQDNPVTKGYEGSEDWLAGKIEQSKKSKNLLDGASTAFLGKNIDKPLFLDIDFISSLKGARDEVRKKGEPQYDRLKKIVDKEGFDPNKTILIEVNHKGEAYIVEGNTRAALAKELGVPNIKAEIVYKNGAELVDSPFSPKNIIEKTSKRTPTEDDYLTLGNASYKTLRGQADESADIKAAEKLFDSSEDYIDGVRKQQAKNREQEKAGKRPFQEEALALEKDKITSKEFREVAFADVEKFKTLEELPTFTEIVFALDKQKRAKGIVGLNKTMPKDVKPIAAGDKVKARLDIPAYNRFDVYVPQITYKKPDVKGAESVFSRTMVIEDVTFPTPTKPAFDISRGRDNTGKAVTKYPHATINGTVASDPATKLMYTDKDAHNLAKNVFDDPDYIHLGYNPDRGGFFYDRETSMPVFDSPLVVQIGKQIFAKRSTETSAERIAKMRKMDVRKVATEKKKPTLFNEGGMAMDDQMEMVFKSSRGYALGGAVEEVDPVSGNEVPTGSLPEEVRDDIPARLSEGEYVVPADVVRYYGVKFFEDLRSQAKMGFDTMEANGRIGGEPMGMEIVEPEDMQFDMSELEVVDDGVMGFDEGGFVDDGGALGLGSEGIGISSGEATTGIETRAYTNDAGDIIYIMFIGNTPMMAIPDGYYPLDEDKKEEPKEEIQKSKKDDGPSTDMVHEGIDYKSLSIDELKGLVDEHTSYKFGTKEKPKNLIESLLGSSFVLGTATKFGMYLQSNNIERELNRRLDSPTISPEEKTSLENLLETHKQKPLEKGAADAAVEEALGGYSPEGLVTDLGGMEQPQQDTSSGVSLETKEDPTLLDVVPTQPNKLSVPEGVDQSLAEAAEIAAANKSAAETYKAGAKQPFLPFDPDPTPPTTDYSNPQLSNEIQDTIGFTSAVFPAQPRTTTSRDDTKSPSETMTQPTSEEPVVIPEPVDPDAFRKRKQKTGVGGRNIGGR